MKLWLILQFLALMSPPQGRLFTTERERQELEGLRRPPPAAAMGMEREAATPQAEEKPIPLHSPALPQLNGIVHRGDDRHTAWVDGEMRKVDANGELIPGWRIALLEADRIELVSPDRGILRLRVAPRPAPLFGAMQP